MRLNRLIGRARTVAVCVPVAMMLLVSQPALAQRPAASPSYSADNQAQFERDRTACEDGRSFEDKTTCLREASAARDARAGGTLTDDASAFGRNAAARCQPLPPDQRTDCLSRVAGQGLEEGTVGEGGILKESITREIVPQPQTRPIEIPPQAPIVPVEVPSQ